MVDTAAEFARKDSEYFALIGRTVAHGDQVAQIIAYQPLRGPEYLFTLQYADGSEVGSPREQFYVLPTRAQIAEIIATRVMRYDSAADVREVDDHEPEALDAGTDAVLALLNGS